MLNTEVYELTEEEKKDRKSFLKKRDQLRKFYDNPEGIIMLTDLLNDLCFFMVDLEDPQETVLSNQARRLLYKLGIWNKHNAYRIVNALLKMPFASEDEHNA